jgi:hypothetical protein
MEKWRKDKLEAPHLIDLDGKQLKHTMTLVKGPYLPHFLNFLEKSGR